MDRRAVEGQGVEDHRGVGRLPSVKGFNKTMSSSLGESNRCMMVRSSPKLFWNGVLDRIICLFAELCTKKRIILSWTPFQNNFEELHTIMHMLLSPNDEDKLATVT